MQSRQKSNAKKNNPICCAKIHSYVQAVLCCACYINKLKTNVYLLQVLLSTQLDMEKSKVEQEKKKMAMYQDQMKDMVTSWKYSL